METEVDVRTIQRELIFKLRGSACLLRVSSTALPIGILFSRLVGCDFVLGESNSLTKIGGLTRRLLSPWLARRGTNALARINERERDVQRASDDELRRLSRSLRYRALSGEPLRRMLPEAFALMREATRRALGMRHFDVQVLGGIAMHEGSVAEMQTGEGKTLTAALPLYLAALEEQGAHLATVNDYLAQRDAELMRPAYALLGMSVGVVQSSTQRQRRAAAYRCDVTYGAAREFGFDFLRDRLLASHQDSGSRDVLGAMLGQRRGQEFTAAVQRELHFALVDEADSILIDEARTPLIVSALPGNSQDAAAALYRWAADVTGEFREDIEYEYDAQERKVELLPRGRRRVRELDKPDALDAVAMYDMYEHVERAIKVELEFHRDRHYVVRDGEIVIVDENTGRLAEGRKWRAGIHQAIEAKEHLDVTVKTAETARVTVQDFFLRYRRLCGMTGTAVTSRRELRRIYQLQVRAIPTNRPEQRTAWPDLVFGTAEAKWQAVVDEVTELHRLGRPVLIGTRSIEKSEMLSKLLRAAGIPHDVLNAHRHSEEAEIVARAGQLDKVTVATNMAGRGTDIKLGDGVAALGGLHVIGTELHESARIDRQLMGRCARQGDPGSFRQFMALDDEIIETAFGPRKARHYRDIGLKAPGACDHWRWMLRAAQRKIERQHYRQRRLLLFHEKERRKLQLEMGQDPYLDTAM